MLKKYFVLIGLFTFLCASLFADYIADRKAAMMLVRKRKNQEAMEAFIKMSEGKVSEFQKSDALEQAINCAIKLKQYDKAMELTKQIPMPAMAKYCEMCVMSSQRKKKELIEKFKDEDFATWPDFLAGPAYRLRGGTYHSLRNGPAAEADLKIAIKYPIDKRNKAKTILTLASTYSTLLKNDDLAIETLRKMYKTGDSHRTCLAAANIANILIKQGKPEEALQELKKVDPTKLKKSATYYGAYLCAKANALAAAGKKAEAEALYKEVLELKRLPGNLKKNCNEGLKKLQEGK